ncbi:transposase [Candidatus Peregrinibacteria bacterium]|nr:transposase [Candidatus Peregrinibacteria bacterium]
MKKNETSRGTGVPPVNVSEGNHEAITIQKRRGAYLPHWMRDQATYAVTFRLFDSLPKPVLEGFIEERSEIVKIAERMKRELTKHERKRLHELHSEKIEKYLHAGHGECWLKNPEIAKLALNAFRHFDGTRYRLICTCIMPHHVHVIVSPFSGFELQDIVQSWKSFTSKEANKILGRAGQFWQPEYYDHLVRGENDLAHAIEYVWYNPEKAGLIGWKWRWRQERGHGQDARATL